MKKWKEKLWVWVAGILALGMFSGWAAGSIGKGGSYQKPEITPPDWVFPVVWSVLYILMAVSGWMVYKKLTEQGEEPREYLLPFWVQLGLNLTWSFLFFGFHRFFISFLWALLLDGAVLWMILSFYPVSRKAALLQMPYLLWGIFAAFLNFMVFRIN